MIDVPNDDEDLPVDLIDDLDEEIVEEVPEEVLVPVKKINYLNNKDMLKEIHRSKNSVSEYTDSKYSDYDVIVEELQEIFLPEVQEKGKIARAARLGAQAFEAAVAVSSIKPKLSEFKVKPDTIDVNDLVYRVLTFEHIPLAPGRKKNPKSIADKHVKLNFDPFKHYIIENGVAKEVGRSHSKNGKFNLERGSITNKLARLYLYRRNERASTSSTCTNGTTIRRIS